MTTYVILSAFVVPAAVAFERWATLRGRRNAGLTTSPAGRHRPNTVEKVDDLHGITYPALYQQYRRFIDLYGYGAEQAAYWAWRKARIAYLLGRAAERRRQRDYVWLSELEADLDREAVKA